MYQSLGMNSDLHGASEVSAGNIEISIEFLEPAAF